MSPPRTPKWKTATLILDQGQSLARVDAALWPPVGALVDPLIVIDLESGGV
jgi:hypothetical protein